MRIKTPHADPGEPQEIQSLDWAYTCIHPPLTECNILAGGDSPQPSSWLALVSEARKPTPEKPVTRQVGP